MKRISALILTCIVALCTVTVNLEFGANLPHAKAQENIVTHAFVSVEPNPAQMYQQVKVTIKIEPAPLDPPDKFLNLNVTLTGINGPHILGFFDSNSEGVVEFQSYALTGFYGQKTVKVTFTGWDFANGTTHYLPCENQTALTVLKPTLAPSPTQAPWSNVGSWQPKASLNVARGDIGVAVVNDRIYAVGGSNGNHAVSDNEAYDPASNLWVTKASMPTPMQYFAIASCQNKIYCINSEANLVYDPVANRWESKAAPQISGDSLVANVVNGKIYLLGGSENGTLMEVYDPASNSWTAKTPMPQTAGGTPLSAVLDGKIYVVASRLQIYDTATDSWSLGAAPPKNIGSGGAGATTGAFAPKRIYFIGYDSPNNFVYDPADDSWAYGADVPTHRIGLAVAVVNDVLYVIGGFTLPNIVLIDTVPTPVRANEQYTPTNYGITSSASPPPSNPLTTSPTTPTTPEPSISEVSTSTASPTQQSTAESDPTSSPVAEKADYGGLSVETVLFAVGVLAVVAVVVVAVAFKIKKR